MKRNYHTETAFLDLLFNTLLCFAALFSLSFVLINPSKQTKNVEAKADFIITVVWPADMDDDVHQLRLKLGVCKAKKEALKLKAKSIEIGFDKWRTDQVSLRTERKNYGA